MGSTKLYLYYERQLSADSAFSHNLLLQVQTCVRLEIIFVPSCSFKETLEGARRQRIFGMMIVDYHAAAIRVTINPLASFSPPVFKAVVCECADKLVL